MNRVFKNCLLLVTVLLAAFAVSAVADVVGTLGRQDSSGNYAFTVSDAGALAGSSSSSITAPTITASTALVAEGILDIGTVATFVDEDATPDVSAAAYFNTNTTAVTITDFDGTGIVAGQIITVVSKGAITFDVTSSGIKGGTTDIITAAGDVTVFLYDGTDWYVVARMDISDNLN